MTRAALLIAALALLAVPANAPTPARLIGWQCDGERGPLYRIEESDFPICERIERIE